MGEGAPVTERIDQPQRRGQSESVVVEVGGKRIEVTLPAGLGSVTPIVKPVGPGPKRTAKTAR